MNLERNNGKTHIVGFVVVNFNTHVELDYCLTCISNQLRRPDRVVVVENGDSSLESKLKWSSNGVDFFNPDQNLGFAAGNNIAANQLKDCDFIALVNPDAYLQQSWLAIMLDAVDRNPDTVCFSSRLLLDSNTQVLDGRGDAYHICGLAWRIGYKQPSTTNLELEQEVFSACAAAALYRRKAFLKCNGFDEDFFCYMEDVDLGFRLRLAGYKTTYVPEAIAYHIGSATTGGKDSNFAVYHGHRNLVWTFVKNMPGLLFWLFLPLHLTMNVTSIIWFSFRGQGKVILRAKWDALKGLPTTWRKRRKIQADRVASVWDIWRALDKSLIPIRRRKIMKRR